MRHDSVRSVEVPALKGFWRQLKTNRQDGAGPGGVTPSVRQLDPQRQKIALVLVVLFNFKLVARGKVKVSAPEASAPPKSSIA
jgi:hypothetical protein